MLLALIHTIHIYNGLKLILIKQMYKFHYIHADIYMDIVYSLPSATLTTHTHAEISYYLFATNACLTASLLLFFLAEKIQIICRVSTRSEMQCQQRRKLDRMRNRATGVLLLNTRILGTYGITSSCYGFLPVETSDRESSGAMFRVSLNGSETNQVSKHVK